LWSETMSPELQYIRGAVERLTRDWPEPQWRHAPPGKWSCAEIVEHLMLTYSGTTKGLSNAMKSGRPLGSRPTLLDRVRTFAVAKVGYFPSGRTSPKLAAPNGGLELSAMRRFYDTLVAMDATLTDAERRFGNDVKLLDHPSVGPLNAQEWRQFHRIHSKHHFKQMEVLARQLDFRSAHSQVSS
jgi:hypothetical protein